MAETESQNQLNAGLRYGGTAAGTLFTILGILQFVTPEQVAQLTAALHDLNQSIVTAYGALTKMGVILGPVAVFWLTKAGVQSSSIKSLAGKLLGIASGPASPAAAEAQKAAIEVTAAVANDPSIPKSTEAKAALLDAVASQPEVVGRINVTDPALVAATKSNQVQEAAA